MKLIHAGKFLKQFFMVAFWVHYIALSVYSDIWFWFTEALPRYLPVYRSIIKIASLLPSNVNIGEPPPLMVGMFFCVYFALWAAIFWALIGGAGGLFLDSVRFFKGKKNINVKQMEAIKPIDAEKWTKWSFVFGFCLYFSRFLIAAFVPAVDGVTVDNLKWGYPNSPITLVAEFLGGITPVFGALFLSTYAAVIGGVWLALLFGIVAYGFNFMERIIDRNNGNIDMTVRLTK